MGHGERTAPGHSAIVVAPKYELISKK